MTDRSLIRLFRALWVLVFLLSAAFYALGLWNGSALGPSVTGDERLSEILRWAVLIPALVPAYATVGAVVGAVPATGWLCLALGTLVAAQNLSWQYAARTLEVDPGSLPAGLPMALTAQVLGTVMVVPLTPLLFPNGRFLLRCWRLLAWVTVPFACLEAFAGFFTPIGYTRA